MEATTPPRAAKIRAHRVPRRVRLQGARPPMSPNVAPENAPTAAPPIAAPGSGALCAAKALGAIDATPRIAGATPRIASGTRWQRGNTVRPSRHVKREAVLARLMSRTESDPRADAVLVQIMRTPDQEIGLLADYFAPEDEQAMMQLPMAGPPPGPAGLPPEAISTVLSRVEQSGGIEGGAQTVAR